MRNAMSLAIQHFFGLADFANRLCALWSKAFNRRAREGKPQWSQRKSLLVGIVLALMVSLRAQQASYPAAPGQASGRAKVGVSQLTALAQANDPSLRDAIISSFEDKDLR